MFPYEKSSTNMLPDGTYQAMIQDVKIYNNPSGPNKLIVDFSLEDGTLFTHFFTPGFKSFDELLALVMKDAPAKGEFDETKLRGINVELTTKINTNSKTGNQYCNVESLVATGVDAVFGASSEPAKKA